MPGAPNQAAPGSAFADSAFAGSASPKPRPELPPVQRPLLVLLGLAVLILVGYLLDQSVTRGLLLLIGLGLGVCLYHAAFGFTGAYRRAMVEGDLSGLMAQAVMLILAMSLFAPILAAGEIFGHRVGGAVAPVDTAMLFGAFLFGIGMQLGGACASGTLFTVGGGNVRMIVTLAFFCLGCWLATLGMTEWRALPSFGALSLGREIGYGPAVLIQSAVLLALIAGFRKLGGHMRRPLWSNGFAWRAMLRGPAMFRGPWPLMMGAVGLALLNTAVLVVAGHPWGVTWGYTLWAGKAAMALGWDPASTAYWSEPWRLGALNGSVLADHSSLTNIGILLGAGIAGSLAGRIHPSAHIPLRSLAAAVIGGVMMGYGARLAYGCNIGAFFSGIASTSVHGWAWIVMALAGNWIGIRLRPLFGLGS